MFELVLVSTFGWVFAMRIVRVFDWVFEKGFGGRLRRGLAGCLC
jgi:hypothetical protein